MHDFSNDNRDDSAKPKFILEGLRENEELYVNQMLDEPNFDFLDK